jgi:hypothetical protein
MPIPPTSAVPTVEPTLAATAAPTEPPPTPIPPTEAPAPTEPPPPTAPPTPTAAPPPAPTEAPRQEPPPSDPDLIAYQGCKNCHNQHPAEVVFMPHPADPTCNTCHRGSPNQIGCPTCHSTHTIDAPHPSDPNLACTSCHVDSVPTVGAWVEPVGPGFVCALCHEVKG